MKQKVIVMNLVQKFRIYLVSPTLLGQYWLHLTALNPNPSTRLVSITITLTSFCQIIHQNRDEVSSPGPCAAMYWNYKYITSLITQIHSYLQTNSQQSYTKKIFDISRNSSEEILRKQIKCERRGAEIPLLAQKSNEAASFIHLLFIYHSNIFLHYTWWMIILKLWNSFEGKFCFISKEIWHIH